MTWTPSPLLCLFAFAVGALVCFALGLLWLSGLFTGLGGLLSYAILSSLGDRKGGAE